MEDGSWTVSFFVTKALYCNCDSGKFVEGGTWVQYVIHVNIFKLGTVFNVMDRDGNKIRDQELIRYIQEV